MQLRTPSWYIVIFTVSSFLSEIFVIPDNRRTNLENLNFLIFKKLAEMPPLICKSRRKVFYKLFCQSTQLIQAAKKSFISRILKISVLGSCSQKNKYNAVLKVTLQGGKHYLLILNMGPVITLFANRKFNNSLKVPASVQSLPASPG